jgi:hypothetical protein
MVVSQNAEFCRYQSFYENTFYLFKVKYLSWCSFFDKECHFNNDTGPGP